MKYNRKQGYLQKYGLNPLGNLCPSPHDLHEKIKKFQIADADGDSYNFFEMDKKNYEIEKYYTDKTFSYSFSYCSREKSFVYRLATGKHKLFYKIKSNDSLLDLETSINITKTETIKKDNYTIFLSLKLGELRGYVDIIVKNNEGSIILEDEHIYLSSVTKRGIIKEAEFFVKNKLGY